MELNAIDDYELDLKKKSPTNQQQRKENPDQPTKKTTTEHKQQTTFNSDFKLHRTALASKPLNLTHLGTGSYLYKN